MTIEIDGLSVSFGGVQALADLTVTLSDPIIGVIGPNGAGKTTLLNAFSGFVEVQRGTITAFGTDLLALSPHRRARWGLRRSFQTEQVVDDLTVAENVRVVVDPLPLSASRKAEEIDRALAFVGMTELAREIGAPLNGFERRMVEIAKAVVGGPKIVLLDEPGAGLDASEVAGLREAIRAIPETFGAIVILIDHDVDLIAATCVSTLVLDFGQRLAYGPTAEVLKDPKVMAAYLGVEDVG